MLLGLQCNDRRLQVIDSRDDHLLVLNVLLLQSLELLSQRVDPLQVLGTCLPGGYLFGQLVWFCESLFCSFTRVRCLLCLGIPCKLVGKLLGTESLVLVVLRLTLVG